MCLPLQILTELSFASANSSIYVLVNVVEIENCTDHQNSSCSPDGFNLYNTNLVFDRNGCIISKYRKFNLFVEPSMNVTDEPEIATFQTDFDVTFGHFICFDILFKSPALDIVRRNVTHILYPSMWYSQAPFLTSVQTQQSFAMANNVVLISAGANDPKNSNTGSGIFVGQHGAVQRLISHHDETRLLIAEVPIDVNDPDYQPLNLQPGYTPQEMDKFFLSSSDVGEYHDLQETVELEAGDLKCKFKVSYTNLELMDDQVSYTYKFVIFNGVQNFADIIDAGVKFCAIVACSDSHESSCGKRLDHSEKLAPRVLFEAISIEMEIDAFDNENTFMMPSSLDFSILPLEREKFVFTKSENKFDTSLLSEVDDLLTFGIYGRNFELDKKRSTMISESLREDVVIVPDSVEQQKEEEEEEDMTVLTVKMTVYVVLMVVLSIVTSIMVYKKLQQPSFDDTPRTLQIKRKSSAF